MTRPGSRSPRSVIRTMTERWFSVSVTRTRVPKGSVLWQAVIAYMLNRSPLAVMRPSKVDPYQEAMPCSLPASRLPAASCGSLSSGVELLAAEADGAVAEGADRSAVACTVFAGRVRTMPASATQETPTSSQNCGGFSRFTLLAFRRITIPSFYRFCSSILNHLQEIRSILCASVSPVL